MEVLAEASGVAMAAEAAAMAVEAAPTGGASFAEHSDAQPAVSVHYDYAAKQVAAS